MAWKDEMEAVVNKKPSVEGRGSGRGRPKNSSATHKALITRNLRLAYGEVASEPVPQPLLDILHALDAKDKQP